jgi:hypothetical protein
MLNRDEIITIVLLLNCVRTNNRDEIESGGKADLKCNCDALLDAW